MMKKAPLSNKKISEGLHIPTPPPPPKKKEIGEKYDSPIRGVGKK